MDVFDYIQQCICNMVLCEWRRYARSLAISGYKRGEIEEYLGELVYIFGKNQLGCQYPICACGRPKELARGEGVFR